MIDDPENERLLDDVLEELAPADFRARLLDRTLGQVRRRRRVRQLSRGILAAACVAGLSFLVFRDRVPSQPKRESSPGILAVIRSQPLDPSRLIQSVPGSVPVIAPAVSTVSVIKTDLSKTNYRELTDDELLALVPGQPAVLVRQGPHQAELLLVDSGSGVIAPGEKPGP